MDATQMLEVNCGWSSRGASTVVGATYVHGSSGHLLVTASDQVVRCNTAMYASGVALQVQSWDFRPDSAQAITVPAVKHGKKPIYYAVRGKAKTELISWAAETTKLDASLPSVGLPSAVHQLFTHPRLDGVVLVTIAGSIHLYNGALTTLVAAPAKAKGKAKKLSTVFAAVDADAAGQLYFAIMTKADAYNVSIYTFDPTTNKAVLHRKDTMASTDDLTSGAFHTKDASLSLLWASGLWQSVSADGVKDLTSLSIAANEGKKRRKVGAVAYQTCEAAPHTVAIASSTDVRLWDSKYGVCLSTHALAPTAHGDLLRVFAFPVHSLALVYEKAVLFTSLHARPSTLATVLGKGMAPLTTTNTVLISTMVDEKDVPVVIPALEVETWPAQMLIGNDAQKEVLEQLTNPSLTPTREAFAAVFDKYVYKNGKTNKIRGVLSPLFVTQVAARCVSSASLGLWRELRVLIRSRHLCSRTLPSLIPTLLAHKQWGLLDTSLRFLADIDEATSIRIVKFVLRHANAASVTRYEKLTKDASVTTPAQFVDHFLHLVVVLPKTDVFLQNAMATLTLPDVLALLALLKKWYVRKDIDMTAVVEWMSLLVDVHFTRLAMVAQHLDACTFMADVHGELDQLLSGALLPQTGTVPDYSVETVLL
ncbi:hypothetical protein SPRG_09063 [Saprolegnia parasitica CBS 223.65]|uniref:Uncharacterized protein n=1 Tax=Saprolegnia parasitica (strain CBS 223.65) TaxID=695850 RepID=A0A067CGV7_SAPPC|nr:hypothetical protein SPRG_09063 [Saprolegnia parasitica CBS 223.65]KDO25766.1 hypothetical protein SPRG_09063 [Saprolegnia parasitica CBS 223.65]|eukprot:XP_012203572.1 hypothetical protein SPRG_09063 [Saprolegnia parasitica CBS 223.65]